MVKIACEYPIHEKGGKEKTGLEKRGKDSIPILLYTESEEKKRKVKTKKKKPAEKRKSRMPVKNKTLSSECIRQSKTFRAALNIPSLKALPSISPHSSES